MGKTRKYDYSLMFITLGIVVFLAAIIAMNGETAPDFINNLLLTIYKSPVGLFILVFTLFCLFWVLWDRLQQVRQHSPGPRQTGIQQLPIHLHEHLRRLRCHRADLLLH